MAVDQYKRKQVHTQLHPLQRPVVYINLQLMRPLFLPARCPSINPLCPYRKSMANEKLIECKINTYLVTAHRRRSLSHPIGPTLPHLRPRAHQCLYQGNLPSSSDHCRLLWKLRLSTKKDQCNDDIYLAPSLVI